jgi:hypothetical protein
VSGLFTGPPASASLATHRFSKDREGDRDVNYFLIGLGFIGFALAVGAYVRVGQLESKLRKKGLL